MAAGMSGAGYFSSAVRNRESSVVAEPARIPQSLPYILPNIPMSQSFFTPPPNSIASFQTVPSPVPVGDSDGDRSTDVRSELSFHLPPPQRHEHLM